MKKKFTEGEWTIVQNNFCIDILCNDKVLATCWGTVKVRSERIANAKLMAAAPDLLHRLNSIVLSVKAHPDYVNGQECDEWHDIVELAEKAINKATE